MEEKEYTHNSIKEIIDILPDNFLILEEKIDMEIQKDFFDSLNDLKINLNDRMEDIISNLNNTDIPVEERKQPFLSLHL